jgi:hypothetical protein
MKIRRVLFVNSLLLIGLSSNGLAQVQTAGSGQTLEGQLSVSIDGGRLTAIARNHSVRRVLEEMSAKAEFRLIFADAVEEQPVSLELKNVPLDEGLRRLLADHDAFLYYGATNGAPASLQTVWVYPKGTASALQPVPPEAWASSKELETSLSNPDPEIRALAYEALISRPDTRSRDSVMAGLSGAREKDDGVRQRIFSAAITRGVAVPPDVLADLVRLDQSEQIRWLALDALSEHPSAEGIAQAALADPSEAVRGRAKEILANLSAAGHRRDNAQPGANVEP